MKVVILAGGRGSRLWPLSREDFPKPLLSLDGERSLLQKTVLRFLEYLPAEDIVIVTSKDLLPAVREQCRVLSLEGHVTFLVEEESLGTAAAFSFALSSLRQEGRLEPREPVLLSPSDAYIVPEKMFVETVLSQLSLAVKGELVLFGVRPRRPETGYGYILIEGGRARLLEKPSLEEIQTSLLEKALWNTGHLLVTFEGFFQQVDVHVREPFSEGISLDKALLEKSDRLSAVELHVAWSDIGSWDSVYELLMKDEQDNALLGPVRMLGTRGSLVIAKERPISLIDVEDLFVVETKEALLIGKRGSSQKVKELDRQSTVFVLRPWGSYTVLEEAKGYKVKKIKVHPGHRLSLQMHHHRSEHWTVVKGFALVERGEESFLLRENESIFIPPLTCHRLSNQGEEDLEVMEIQSGSRLEEEDIVRFEDDYARSLCSC